MSYSNKDIQWGYKRRKSNDIPNDNKNIKENNIGLDIYFNIPVKKEEKKKKSNAGTVFYDW